MDKLMRFAWVFGVTGFFALLIFLSLWFLNQSMSGPWTTGFGVAAGLLLAAYGYLDRDTLEHGVQSRAFRYGFGAFAMVLLALAVAVTAYVVAKDHDTRWDITGEKRFSLSDRSKSVAAGLDKDVQIVAFFRSDSPEHGQFERLVEGYAQASDRIEVEWFDPLLNPRMADRFNITSDYGTVVMQSGDDRQRLESDFSEGAVTEALIRLASGTDHRICWAVGHDEADPDDDNTAGGLGGLVLKLEDMNYTITKSNTLTTGIERECEALVIARPTRDWLPVERERLAVYLAEGGRALVLLEPETVPELATDLRRYGVIVGDDIVIEADPSYRLADVEDPAVIAISGDSLARHPVTRSLRGVVVLWVARSIKSDPSVAGLATHELMTGSERSWGETTLDVDLENIEATPDAFVPNEGVDLVGRVPLAVAVEILDPSALDVGAPAAPPEPEPEGVEGPAPPPGPQRPGTGIDLTDTTAAIPADFEPKAGGRLVVFGDADFASNQLYPLGNNQDLFTNAVAWLVDEESQLGEGPDEEGDVLTLNVLEGLLVWFVSVFLVPGLSIGLAVLVMIRRRFL